MMKQLLEKERLWFWTYIAINVAGAVLGVIYTAALFAGGFFSPMALLLFGVMMLMNIYGFLYLLYRLLYLWRGTPKRVLWTVLCLFTVVWGWIPDATDGGAMYILSGLLGFVSLILTVACLVHDYAVITGAVEQHIPGEENVPSDSGDGN